MTTHPDSPQRAPGTTARPILDDSEASRFTRSNYFTLDGEVWTPRPIADDPDALTVGPPGSNANFNTVQQAINAAIAAGNGGRRAIRLLPGVYAGAVYIPIDAPR